MLPVLSMMDSTKLLLRLYPLELLEEGRILEGEATELVGEVGLLLVMAPGHLVTSVTSDISHSGSRSLHFNT